MTRYVIKRLLLFIPSLAAVTVIAFLVLIHTPGNPVDRLIQAGPEHVSLSGAGSDQKIRDQWIHQLGLDLPVFYLSVQPQSEPDEINRYTDEQQKQTILRLCHTTGKPQLITSLHELINSKLAENPGDSALEQLIRLKNAAVPNDLVAILDRPQFQTAVAEPAFTEIRNRLSQPFQTWRNYVPAIRIHPDNRYHRWLFGDGNWLNGEGAIWSKGIVRGDFGLSYQTRQPVSEVIGSRIKWSLLLSMGSVLLALLISIPVAAAAARRPGSWMDRATGTSLTLLFSIPSFWLATLLLMVFANPDILYWFPASGVKPAAGFPPNAGIFEKMWIALPYLVLPLLAYTYSSVAFLSSTLRASLKDALAQDYVRTARAKGLESSAVVYRHAVRNSLLPIITVSAHVFPAAIGGSVILETIFSIPGMGSETVMAIQNQNIPMVVAVFTITSVLTMAGILVADILYAVADPRIRYNS